MADLSERVDLALRARSRADLEVAMRGLPLVWEDLPTIVHTSARRLHRGVRRARFLFMFARVWVKLSLGLALVFGTALIAGAPVGTALGALLIVWALASFASWRVCRRSLLP